MDSSTVSLSTVSQRAMTRRGWLLFASMCVIWGRPYLLIRVSVREVSPATLVLARTAVAALLLVPIAAARDELRPVLRRWPIVLVFAAIEIAIPWVALGSAEEHLSSSLTALLIATVPLVATVIAATTGTRQRFGAQNLIGLALGMLGVAAIVGLHVGEAGAAPLVELAIVVVCYATGPMILQRWLADLPALGVIAVSIGATALVYVPIASFSLPGQMPSATVVGSVLTLAVVCTALAFLLFFALIAEIGPVRSTVITYVNPAVAAILGVVILGESFTTGMGLGFALVLAGSVLATRPSTGSARSPIPTLRPDSESAA
jgi:drug/metabolite transporter (DMT)-like permease